MGFEDAWDWFTEKLSEGWEQITDIFSNMFTGLGEISYGGLIVGIMCAGLVLILKKYMFDPFHASLFTFVLTLILTFAAGYLSGRAIFESG